MSREGTGVTYTLEPAQLLWKNRPWGGGGQGWKEEAAETTQTRDDQGDSRGGNEIWSDPT